MLAVALETRSQLSVGTAGNDALRISSATASAIFLIEYKGVGLDGVASGSAAPGLQSRAVINLGAELFFGTPMSADAAPG